MRCRSRAATYAANAGAIAILVACGTQTPTEPPLPLPAPVQSNTVTITSAGADPRNLEVLAGDRVLFINNDSRSHNMTSDPHPEHDLCPEINQVGFLSPGQRRETGNLVIVETCGFHDHDNPEIQSLHGQIAIK